MTTMNRQTAEQGMSGIYGLEMLLPLSTTKTLDIIHRTNIREFWNMASRR